MSRHEHGPGEAETAELFEASSWEKRYSGEQKMWSGKPNSQLVAEVSRLAPGTALAERPGHVLQMRRHVADPFSARERVAITALPKEMQDAQSHHARHPETPLREQPSEAADVDAPCPTSDDLPRLDMSDGSCASPIGCGRLTRTRLMTSHTPIAR